MSYAKELDFAKSLAFDAGIIMRKYFGFDIETEWKSDETPLTKADTKINDLVIARIQMMFPGDSVYGEEKSALTDSSRLWVCDPIDGTMPFSHGLPISTFSLALVVHGTPVVGVIYDPFMNRLFSAALGQGAFCNDQPIQVSDQSIQNSLINIEAFPVITKPSILQLPIGEPQKSILEAGGKTTCLWSVIISFALIAAGQYSAALFNLDQIHDVAAAKIIVEEAGGTTSDLFGNDQRYDQPTKGFAASNGVIHQQLIDFLK